MIKNKKERSGPIEVDLTGPEGNAFVLLGYARQWCKQLDKDFKPIHDEATSGDYEHLVATLGKEFGEFVTFLR